MIFCFTYIEPTHQSDEVNQPVQMIFSTWFGYFDYVSYLPCGITLIVPNVSIWLLLTLTGLSNHGAKSSEQSPAGNFANTFDMFDQSQHLHQTLHKSFFFLAFQLCFYLCWNNKAWYAKKCCFFPSIFSLKTATQNSLILILFFNARLIWQLSQYNLTKLFQMKLKTTKHY